MNAPEPRIIRSPRGNSFAVLEYPQEGDALPVVLIHGLLCSVYFWFPGHFGPFGKRSIYSIALPGHYPASPIAPDQKIDENYLVEECMFQVKELLGDKPCILAGHSTGATVALLMASRYPEQFKGVISLGGVHTGEEEGGLYRIFQVIAMKLGSLAKFIISPCLAINGMSLAIHKIMMRDVAGDPKNLLGQPDINEYIDYYFPAQQKLSGSSMVNYFRDLAAVDASEEIRQIKQPALVLCGDKDPYISNERTKYLASLIPNSTLHFVPGSGHVPMMENRDSYRMGIEGFLAQFKD